MAQVKPRYGICECCVRTAKWFPVIFIVCVIVWSYYAYVIQLCIFTVESIGEKLIYLLFYHAVLAIFAWSYWQTVFTEIGTVPKQFKLSPTDVDRLDGFTGLDEQCRFLEHLAKDLPISCRTVTGVIRYCEKCQAIKPDRCHHCSVCGVCVLKMDHHCPWVNNCVAFTNYKFFILFLGYSLLYCVFITLTTLSYFVKFWKNELPGMGKFHILFLFFVAAMFALSLTSLFSYHIYLVLMNRSTLESFRAPMFRTGPDKKGFYLGNFNNFIEVFGDDWRLWFLPIKTCLGDGIRFPQRCVDEDTDELLGGRQRWAEGLDNDASTCVTVPDGDELTDVVTS